MLVVDSLDTTTAGDIILGSGQLHLRIVGKIKGCLHQALAIGARSQHHGTVEVLQRTTGNLTGRSRLSVDHHHHGHHRIDGLHGGAVFVITAFQFANGLHYRLTIGYKHIHDTHGLGEQTAAIAAKVYDQGFHSLLFQIDKRPAEVTRAIFRERIQIDIAYTVLTQSVIRDAWELDGTARDALLENLSRRGTLYLQQEGCAGIAAKMRTDIRHILVGHRGIIDAEDDVTFLQSSLSGRRILIGLIDNDALQFRIVADQGTDSRILTRQRRLQFVHFLCRVIDSIRIKRLQHGLDASPDGLSGTQCIHVGHIEVPVDGIEYLQVLRRLEIMVLSLLSHRGQKGAQRSYHQQKDSLHLIPFINRMQKYNILRKYLNFSRKSLAVSKKRLTFAPAIRKKSTCFSSSVG